MTSKQVTSPPWNSRRGANGHRAGRSPCAHSIGKFFLCFWVLFLLKTSTPACPGTAGNPFLRLLKEDVFCRFLNEIVYPVETLTIEVTAGHLASLTLHPCKGLPQPRLRLRCSALEVFKSNFNQERLKRNVKTHILFCNKNLRLCYNSKSSDTILYSNRHGHARDGPLRPVKGGLFPGFEEPWAPVCQNRRTKRSLHDGIATFMVTASVQRKNAFCKLSFKHVEEHLAGYRGDWRTLPGQQTTNIVDHVRWELRQTCGLDSSRLTLSAVQWSQCTSDLSWKS